MVMQGTSATKEQRDRWRKKQQAKKRAEKESALRELAEEKLMPEILRDFRHVYKTTDGQGDTPGQEVARSLLLRDAKGFVFQMSRMESEWRQMRANANAAAAADGDLNSGGRSDIKTEECVRLAEQLLADLTGKDG